MVDKDKKEININKLKEIQLNIMDEIHNFCEKNGIKYYLAGGTLIGAIRHQGYIPWDDDIDIFIKRKDYEYLINNFISKNNIKIISFETNNDFYLTFAKAINTETILKEDINSNLEIGIYVDIFPLDVIPSSKIKYFYPKQKFLITMLNIKNSIIKKRGFLKNFVIILGKALICFVPRKYIIKKINRNARKYADYECDTIGDLVPVNFAKKDLWDIKLFDKSKLTKFEDRMYYIPCEYDKILRIAYGDYMKLPPLEEQKTNHSYKAWWK